MLLAYSATYFNSTMVRLKDTCVDYESGEVIFQFHYGTIKSKTKKKRQYERLYFNSTMVRLKVCPSSAIMHGLTHFNSTMVRLKDGKKSASSETRIRFKFHYGTIKSALGFGVLFGIRISIPLWYD